MINYINNKEWIFQGIGVTVIVSILSVIGFLIKKWIYRKKDLNNTTTIVQKQKNNCFSNGYQIGIQNNYHDKKERNNKND